MRNGVSKPHPLQKENFDFFLLRAVGIKSVLGQDRAADFFIVLNGELCTPCTVLDRMLSCALPLIYFLIMLRFSGAYLGLVAGPKSRRPWTVLPGSGKLLASRF